MMRVIGNIGIGLVIAGSTLLAAALLIAATEPIYGQWGWREVALIALLLEALVLGLQALRGDAEPRLRCWDTRADPQAESP